MRVSASAILLFVASPAYAANAAHNDMQIGATVAHVCRLGNATVTGGQNATYSASDQGGAINLTALADPNTAYALPSSISVTFSSVCNQTLVLKLVSAHGGLTPTKSVPQSSAFADRVDYTASLDWGGSRTTLSTDGAAGAGAGVSVGGAQAGSVTLNIEIPAGTQPLVSGGYSDVLTVEFDSSL